MQVPGDHVPEFTLLVPTRNRPDFLLRCLEFYARRRFPFPVVVMDSSSPDQAEQVARVCRSMAGRLAVDCLPHESNISFPEKVCSGLRKASSPFVGLAADDDFVLPEAIYRGLEFLRARPDYSAAVGKMIVAAAADSDRGQTGAPLKLVDYLGVRTLAQDRAVHRFRSFIRSGFVVFYGVMRRSVAVAAWEATARLPHAADGRFEELLPSYLTVINGKVKGFRHVHWVFQAHASNTAIFRPTIRQLQDSGILEAQRAFVESVIAQALATRDGIPEETARRQAAWCWRRATGPSLAGRKPLRARAKAKLRSARSRLWRLREGLWRMTHRGRAPPDLLGTRKLVRDHVPNPDQHPDLVEIVRVVSQIPTTLSQGPKHRQSPRLGG